MYVCEGGRGGALVSIIISDLVKDSSLKWLSSCPIHAILFAYLSLFLTNVKRLVNMIFCRVNSLIGHICKIY